jgi:predicted permease
MDLSYLDLVDLRSRAKTVSALIGSHIGPVDLTSAGKPQRLWASLTTANYFSALGVKPLLGRFFVPDEETRPGGSPVAVLSYRTWQLLFDGDPGIVGRTIYLNQHPITVIGVAPALFEGTNTGLRMDVWAPLMMDQQLGSGWDAVHHRDDYWLSVIGILKPGVTQMQAQQELTGLMKQIAAAYPLDHQGNNAINTIPMWKAPNSANEYLSRSLPPLMAIALVVLLLACVNVANLFLVRAVARRREMAVRLSLGATRSRLVRQLLVESVLVALAGGLLALFVTLWSTRTFDRFVPPTDIPIQLNMHVDGRVLAVTFLLSTVTGLAFGLLPALRSSRIVPVTVLKEEAGSTSGGRHKARLISILVVAQIALSFLLLICGGLFIRSFRRAEHADPGFRGDHVLLSTVDLFPAGYTRETGLQFQREALRRIEEIPGVETASFSNWSPLGFRYNYDTVTPEGYAPQKDESLSMMEDNVGPNYLTTLGIPLVAGRDILATDTGETQNVAVVNETFVKQYWHGQNALGRRVRMDGDWWTVVGVAKNAKYRLLEEAPQPFAYKAALQDYESMFVLYVKVKGDPNAYADAVTKAVHTLNADLPVLNQYPLSRNVETASMGTRIAGTFVGMFGLIGLALAAIGIYGVIAYSTRQRLHELGIRMALGAQRRDIFELVLKQGLRLAVAGIGVGLLCSLGLTPLLRSQLYGVSPSDVLTYVSVAFLLCSVALAACCLPALRAAQVEPVRVLRYE